MGRRQSCARREKRETTKITVKRRAGAEKKNRAISSCRTYQVTHISEIRFTIPGRVAGKGRPRAFVRGGKIGTYTPEKTRNAEAMVRAIAHEAMAGRALLDGPIALQIIVHIVPPASWSKKRRNAAMFVTGKPDSDNICKTVADSLNGICYRDDSQIAVLSIGRYYTLTGPERVEVNVRSLTAESLQVAA